MLRARRRLSSSSCLRAIAHLEGYLRGGRVSAQLFPTQPVDVRRALQDAETPDMHSHRNCLHRLRTLRPPRSADRPVLTRNRP